LICDLFVTSQRYGWIKMSLLVASWHAAATASNLSFWPPVSARRRLHLQHVSRKWNDNFGGWQRHWRGEFGNQDNKQTIALSSEVAYPCSANAIAVAGKVIFWQQVRFVIQHECTVVKQMISQHTSSDSRRSPCDDGRLWGELQPRCHPNGADYYLSLTSLFLESIDARSARYLTRRMKRRET
jgi:hypothetical protein